MTKVSGTTPQHGLINMAKITQTNNGDTGLIARTNFNTALKSVETATNISGDGTVGSPLEATLSIDDLTDAYTDYTTDNNFFLGLNAGASIVAGGVQNVFIGQQSGTSTDTGINNTGLGYQSLLNNVGGGNNTALGRLALQNNVGKSKNTAIGSEAMRYAHNITTVSVGNNTAIGHQALRGSTTPANNTGISNVAIGTTALANNTTGSNNIAIGFSAGNLNTTGIGNILIGRLVDAPSASTSDHLNIGDTIYANMSSGNVGIGEVLPSEKFHVKDTNVSIMVEGDGVTKAGFKVKTNGVDRWDINTPSAQTYLTFVDDFANDVLTLTQGGNIGIGTTVISAKLHVKGDFIRLQESAAGRTLDIYPAISGESHRFSSTTTGSGYSFENNIGTLFTISNTGNIGIGIVAPLDRLHVRDDDPVLNIETAATPAGSGSTLRFGATQGGSDKPIAEIVSHLTNGSESGRAGHLKFFTSIAGSLFEGFRITDKGVFNTRAGREVAVIRSAVSFSTTGNASIYAITDTSAPRTVTISSTEAVDGRILTIKDESLNATNNNITIATEGSETIDGLPQIVISASGGSVNIYSDGTNYFTT